MLKRPVSLINPHIMQNRLRYITAVSALCIGVIFGIMAGLGYREGEGGMLSGFFSGLSSFSSKGLLYDGAVQSAILSGMMLVFGLSPIGCILVPALCAYKGFALGFSAGAVYSVYKIRSLVFAALGLLPSCIFWIPGMLFASVFALKSSLGLFKMLTKKGGGKYGDDMAVLLIVCVILFLTMFFSKIIEIYFVPSVLNVVGGIYL